MNDLGKHLLTISTFTNALLISKVVLDKISYCTVSYHELTMDEKMINKCIINCLLMLVNTLTNNN